MAKLTPKMEESEIIYKKVTDLIPYVNNARTHSDEQVLQISASIKEFGFTNPVLIDSENGIIAGHGRVQAAIKLKMTEVPTICLSDLTKPQIKAYILADNRLAENAGWDLDLISIELQELKDLDFDIELTGFSLDDIIIPDNEGLTDEDAVPDVPETPVTVLGDVWILGNHRMMCGDSTSIDAVEKLMDGKTANICFTSPPYNVGSMNIKGQSETTKKYNSFDDSKTYDEFFDFITANMNCMFSVCDEIFYNIGLVQNNKGTIFKVIDHYSDKFKDIIYWKKRSVAPHIQKGIINNLVEFIMCFGNGNRKFVNAQFSQGTYFNVIEGNNASSNEFSEIHKATFPVYLPENIINNFTSRNGLVIDSFGGTGTTLIACEKTNRNCYMMELDEKYCDVIIKRWEQYTGNKAVLESTGLEFKEVA